MSYNLGVNIEASAYLNYAAGMFRLDIYLHAVTHIKDLIHLTPVCPRAFMNSTEERRHREHIVFDYMNISRDEMQNLCLCASCTMYHSVNVMTHLVKDTLDDKGIPYTETDSLENSLKDLDILYMTRVQRERFFNEEDYLRLKDTYVLTPEKLKNAGEGLKILHPLPRVNEISVAVDSDPRACYFKQVLYGQYMRMALILMLLEIE